MPTNDFYEYKELYEHTNEELSNIAKEKYHLYDRLKNKSKEFKEVYDIESQVYCDLMLIYDNLAKIDESRNTIAKYIEDIAKVLPQETYIRYKLFLSDIKDNIQIVAKRTGTFIESCL